MSAARCSVYLIYRIAVANKVYVNLVKYPEGNIKIFHCHTNEMPLSIQDMSFLCNDLVDDVVVVTIRGEVFHVSVGTGERVSYDEYCERVSVVAADADTSILDNEDFWDWDEPRRNYEVCKETMVRIALEFKWSLKGGTVDEL